MARASDPSEPGAEPPAGGPVGTPADGPWSYRGGRRRRPSFLVVVMDCVRASDFPGGAVGVAGLPTIEALRHESIVFERAASVAPWTIPAHASLFTGRYPWEHRAHAKGRLQLDEAAPRLPSLLRPYGYRSLLLSANPLLSPAFGLTAGFDAAAWSEWWEPYVRMTPSSHRPRELGERRAPAPSVFQRIHDSPLVGLLHRSADVVYRHPFLVDGANRFLQRLLFPRDPSYAPVAGWIEPTFDAWLRSLPPDAPYFTVVNLLDAHEPYFADPEVVRSLRDYLRYVRTPQDRPSVISGRWAPTPTELDLIRRLYRASLKVVDQRLSALIDILRRSGRWDDTYLILTSDHGQAFGEHGTMFHMHRADEPLLRIPLWVRAPGGRGGGATAVGWASLVDIAPTVLAAAGAIDLGGCSGVPLSLLERAERPDPLPAMADGLALDQERRQLTEERQRWVDRVWAAAYRGDLKVVFNISDGALTAFNIRDDPAETHDLWSEGDPRLAPLAAEARRVASELGSGAAAERSDDVEERLRSWGYI